ncbi:MAG: alpha-amylase, partial [Treponema sp.]|nr:alpha-amylase [Treponema sp.]
GTGMPWNDTAQIDFLNPNAREAVMQQIMKVAANFPIIRFDAAMVLAKKHIRRLWYPEPGHGGDIATRSRYSMSTQQFEDAIPNEFWREVVDRCAQQMPDTLLLAEAFWMMEGYFTRTLGMHRVYNSAFMNMLKKEENQKYRDTVKNTIKFDPQVLKRFVNFMNNPDEETAVAQFGKGDKYFGVCTLMVTMPGLPMFGHGQIEGFEEKYGMEYTRAYRDETPDQYLVDRHCHDIFPLMHKRYLFSGVENFLFYDVWNQGIVNENIFAYSNSAGNERSIVFYNNKYERAAGWIRQSCEYAIKTGSGEGDVKMMSRSLSEGMGLTKGKDNFMIFREHKSGLWYVRSSDDIIENGMFVSLNGFEYQVYLDVHQVTDGAEGKFAKLNELLNGSGVPDLEVAWQEYKYKELYAALEKFASPEVIEKLTNLLTPVAVLKSKNIEQPKLEEVFKEVKKNAIAYYELEAKFAAGAVELAKAEKELAKEKSLKTKPAGTQKESRVNKKSAEATPEKRYLAFCRQMEYLSSTMAAAQGVSADSAEVSGGTHYRVSASALKMDQENLVYDGLIMHKNSAEILCCFAMVSSAGKENCLNWGYDRKLAQILDRAGIRGNEIRNIFRSLFIMMKVRDLNFGATGFAKSTEETARILVEGPDSFLLTGANDFNGVRWFNKEKMDDTLWYAFAAITMYSPRNQREQIHRLIKTLSAAKERAEYKCANFLEALIPEKKTAKKKPAVKSKAKE